MGEKIKAASYEVVDAIASLTTAALEETDHETQARLSAVFAAGTYELVTKVKFGGPAPVFEIKLHGVDGTEAVLSVFGELMN